MKKMPVFRFCCIFLLLAVALFNQELTANESSGATSTNELSTENDFTGIMVDITGRLDVIQVDHSQPEQLQLIYLLEDTSSKLVYSLKFKEQTPKNLASGSIVRVRGNLFGNEIAVTSLNGGDIETLSHFDAASVEPQQTLVMVADFNDVPVSCSIESIRDIMFSDPQGHSINDFYQANSHGRVSFVGDVAGPFTLDYASSDDCNYYGWAYAAEEQAIAEGYDLSRYQRKVFVMPANQCGFSGIANIGGNPSRAWVYHCDKPEIYAHELGHNLKMHHAATPFYEYGDHSDVMGSTNAYHYFNAPHQEQMGWITDTHIKTITESGLYQVAPIEQLPELTLAPQILKIAKRDTQDYYYLSYRRNLDEFSNLSCTYQNRMSVHQYRGDGSSSKTYLLGTYDQNERFVDTVNVITATPLMQTADLLYVNINFDEICVAAEPSLELTPTGQIGPAGDTLFYTLSLTNNDNDICPESAFQLAANLPEEWRASFSSEVIDLMAGETATSVVSLTSPTHAEEAHYFFSISALDHNQPKHDRNIMGVYRVYTDLQAPTPPLLSGKGANTRVELSWSGAQDDVGVVSYAIWRDQSVIAATRGTRYTDFDVIAGNSYQYFVTALDAAENESSPSASLVITATDDAQ